MDGSDRTSTHTSKHKLNYYRCIGSDGYRRLNGPLCTNRPIRQDYLDEFVWDEVIRLLDDPGLIQAEIDRRRDAARNADPLRKREEELRREQARVEKCRMTPSTIFTGGKTGLPFSDVAGAVDSACLTFFGMTLEQMRAGVDAALEGRGILPLEGGFMFHQQDCRCEADVRARMGILSAAGFEGVIVYCYGLATAEHWKWLKEGWN